MVNRIFILIAVIISMVALLTPPERGIQGLQGHRGFTGAAGADGEAGPTGIVGFRGFTGLDGATGGEGPRGEIGDTGDPGVLFYSTISLDTAEVDHTAFVLCPDGTKVLYGDSQVIYDGFPNPPWIVLDAERSGFSVSQQGFVATWVNTLLSPDDTAWYVQAYAICLDPDFIRLGETLEVTNEND